MSELDPEITPEVWAWVQANYSRPTSDKSFYTFAALVETRHRAKLASSQAEIERLRGALRNIAEGNLGDDPWQANYAKIKQVAAAALSGSK